MSGVRGGAITRWWTPLWRTGIVCLFAVPSLAQAGIFSALAPTVWRVLLVTVAGILATAAVLVLRREGRIASVVGDPVTGMIVAFVFLAAMSSLGAEDTAGGLAQSAILLLMLSACWLGVSARDRSDVMGDVSTIVATAISLSVLASALGLAFPDSSIGPYGRLIGSFSNANYVGMVAAFAIVGAAVLVRPSATRASRVAWIVAAGACLPALAWSGSRGGFVAVGVGVLLLLIQAKRWWMILAVSGAAGAIALVLALAPALAGRFLYTDITAGRLDIWAEAFGAWLEAPWLGVGYRSFESGETGALVHNLGLSVLVETGIFGLLVFVALLLTLVVRGQTGALLPLVLTILIVELTESSMFGWMGPTAFAFWFVIFANARLSGSGWPHFCRQRGAISSGRGGLEPSTEGIA